MEKQKVPIMKVSLMTAGPASFQSGKKIVCTMTVSRFLATSGWSIANCKKPFFFLIAPSYRPEKELGLEQYRLRLKLVLGNFGE